MTQPPLGRETSQFNMPRSSPSSERIPPELVKQIADEVYALLKKELTIQNERSRSSGHRQLSTLRGGR